MGRKVERDHAWSRDWDWREKIGAWKEDFPLPSPLFRPRRSRRASPATQPHNSRAEFQCV